MNRRPNVAEDDLPRSCRPEVRGKFLYVDSQKLYIKGVTYGPFRRDEQGSEYGSPEQVSGDFEAMAAGGINAVRTYTPPPRWLLDSAQEHGLRVMVGLPWEQHIAFLDEPGRTKHVEERVRTAVRGCAGHPAVLCYSVGNEIPAPIVRWHGARRIERFLRRLYLGVKAEDPGALITYVNYPSTEYLQLPFLDFVSFNVYLEAEDRLAAYLARLQNLAGDRPLVLAEIGLDSRRNGHEGQAKALDWQVRTAFSAGCAGAFVFAWTDEWHRGGFDIEDWDFGLTDRERRPKPALETVQRMYGEAPLQRNVAWPRVSVVVCTFNGSRTIRECCEGLRKLDYPDYEVIVVDDGSTDGAGEIAASYGFRVIRTENQGLSSARNTGWKAATGEIVAYIDDDAWPDPHWLHYTAAAFLSSDHVAVGGPNLPPPGDGPIAEAVARAPGGPTHVLLSDQIAEHIPGCNMAFRRDALSAVGGFDPQFRAAGDDVDLCWRLQARGWTLGFSPAALVWHHRRNSIKAYWRQQRNYGKAEALLEMKWPEKYNPVGHVTWEGRLYGSGLTRALMWRSQRIYHGVWGMGLFQSLYDRRPGLLNSLPLMPEWYLVIAGLAALSLLGLLWTPLLSAAPLLALACAAVLVQAADSVAHAPPVSEQSGDRPNLRVAGLTLLLHLLQPLARLLGRVRYGLTPWRRRCDPCFTFPRPRTISIWSEKWKPLERYLEIIEARLRDEGSVVRRGGEFDRYDLEIRGGLFGGLRLLATVEEHGAGKQLVRVRALPRFAAAAFALTMISALLAVLALFDGVWIVAVFLAVAAGGLVGSAFADCAAAQAAGEGAVSSLGVRPGQPVQELSAIEKPQAATEAQRVFQAGRQQ